MAPETMSGSSSFEGKSISDSFYPLYRRLFSEDSEFVADVEEKLAAARMPHTVEFFLSWALAIGVLLGLMLWLGGIAIGYVIFVLFIEESPTLLGLKLSPQLFAIVEALKIPALVLVTGIIFGLVGFGIGFGAIVSVPYYRAGERKREINMLLPDSISFMYALSVGGMNQIEILQAMAKAEDTYGEVAKEFQSIVLETEYFDTDYRSAIRNQAMQSPSDELGQFLTDMLSIVNSGGDMTRFLDDKKEKHMRTAKQEQELQLETLELFGEMYMTLSLFPLLLIIILVIMSMLGEAQDFMLYGTVYGLIPMTGIGFLVLVATVKSGEPGDGYLHEDDPDIQRRERGMLGLGLIERYAGTYAVFDRIKSKEGTFVTMELLRKPHHFFRDYPLATLALTVPAAIVLLGFCIMAGLAPASFEELQSNPVGGTFFWVYMPMYVTLLPLAVFNEWNLRSRWKIIKNLSDDLRKLSSANDTGLTLLESLKVVADTSRGKLAEEFEAIHAKVNYGMSLKEALIEFNNHYHIPRLARTVKLVSKAQETSSNITDVLSTAAQASENQDDIDRERVGRTRMQIVIIIMTYLVLLGVMAILKVKFLDTMAGLSAQASGDSGAFGGGLNIDMLTMLFFHAVTLQALMSGFIAGYMRDASLLSGVKYAVILPTFALLVFMLI
ncbi:type II secretion system F family protein [Haladaptatus sp. DYSN1]|uniref:type II secretion system F family protein n=1 Tax=unclassified Haladaptatus TaxID=2622732 RepID=UPI0034E93F3A